MGSGALDQDRLGERDTDGRRRGLAIGPAEPVEREERGTQDWRRFEADDQGAGRDPRHSVADPLEERRVVGAEDAPGEDDRRPAPQEVETAEGRHRHRHDLALGAFETAVAGPAVRARLEAAREAMEGAVLAAADGLASVAAAAAAGDAAVRRLLDEEARYVALGIAAICAVTDPQLVVLSGGVGALPALLEPVRAHVATLAAGPPPVVTSLLGDRAPLVGAIGLAVDLARAT